MNQTDTISSFETSHYEILISVANLSVKPERAHREFQINLKNFESLKGSAESSKDECSF